MQAQTPFWHQSNGPYGAQVFALTSDASGAVYAATGSGVYKTMDEGAHWSQPSTTLHNQLVQALITAPNGTIVAGTNAQGVYISTDQGATWQARNSGISNTNIFCLLAARNGDLYAGTAGGTVKSTNQGQQWQPTNSASFLNALSFAQDSAGVIYLGDFINLYASMDNGLSWHKLPVADSNAHNYSIAANKQGYLFLGTDSGLYRSKDNAATWSKLNIGAKPYYYFSSILTEPNSEVYATTYDGMLHSIDNGDTWSFFTVRGGANSIVKNANGHLLVGALGVQLSVNGGTVWMPVNFGMTNTYINSIVAKASGDIFAAIAGIAAGIFHSSDNGTSWIEANLRKERYGIVQTLAILANGNVLAGTYGSGIFCTPDNAATWKPMNAGLTDSIVNAIAASPSGPLIAGTRHKGAFLSQDNGLHWAPIFSTPKDTNISAAASDSSGGFVLGTPQGKIFRSINSGSTWSDISPMAFFGFVKSIAINRSGNIFASVLGHGILKSIDNGMTWRSASIGLADSFATTIAISPHGEMYASGYHGVSISNDNGVSWQDLSSGLTTTFVNAIAASPQGIVFAGTYGGGVFRGGNLSEVAPSRIGSRTFSLLNYPNPFNTSTSISYWLESPCQSHLTIYNEIGNEVLRVDQPLESTGPHQLKIECGELPSGVYRYVLTAGSQHLAGTMNVIH